MLFVIFELVEKPHSLSELEMLPSVQSDELAASSYFLAFVVHVMMHEFTLAPCVTYEQLVAPLLLECLPWLNPTILLLVVQW